MMRAKTEEGSVEAEDSMFVAVYKYLLATDESSEGYPVCLRMHCDLHVVSQHMR